MTTVLMDILRIGVPAVAFILFLKFVFGSLITIPGLSSLAMAI